MAAIDVTNTNIGIALSEAADPYGTALACEDKLICESFTYNENATTLSTNSIGSGGLMQSDASRGNIAGSFSCEMIMGYENGFDKFLTQMLGVAATPTEQNVGEADYLHVIAASGSLNARFLTIAFESSSTTVIEFPSCTVTDITITMDNPANYCRASITGTFDQMVLTGTENSNAELQALTVPDTELAKIEQSDEFLINLASSGALTTSTHRLAITSYVLNLSRAQRFQPEIKGSAGNGSPIADGRPLAGTLALQLKNHVDNTWETAASAGSEYKSSIKVEGAAIGSGDNKKIEILLPRMQIPSTPDYGLNDPGTNPTSLTFELSEASANPTGMSDTTPYFEITNERTTAYAA